MCLQGKANKKVFILITLVSCTYLTEDLSVYRSVCVRVNVCCLLTSDCVNTTVYLHFQLQRMPGERLVNPQGGVSQTACL